MAPQVGLGPTTLRLTADESITTSIVIDNSQTELVIRSVSATRIVPLQPFELESKLWSLQSRLLSFLSVILAVFGMIQRQVINTNRPKHDQDSEKMEIELPYRIKHGMMKKQSS